MNGGPSGPPAAGALQTVSEALARRFGLRLDPRDQVFPGLVERRMRQTGASDARQYVALLDDPTERRALLADLTVGETSFFRHPEQLQLFASLLPAAVAAAGDRPFHILSAGCSTGEEVWTLAMIARDALPPALAARVFVSGIDVNPDALERARAGRYTEWALRDTPEATRRAWFRPSGGEHVVDPALRGMVAFHERNLVEDDPFWRRHAFDVVFCRNVAIYLTRDAVRDLLLRFAHALRPEGHLFLGPVESLRSDHEAFELHVGEGASFYRKRTAAPAGPARPAAPRRSDRAVRARRAPAPRAPSRAGATAGPPWSHVHLLLREERYHEALEALSGDDDGIEARTLRAVACLGAGAIGEGERLASTILRGGVPSAGAHCLRALCRESAGDDREAIDHLQVAILQDPLFALPHLHLGRLARRAGDLATARRAFATALRLLPAEDELRILLFGGGFRRAALLHLCRDEVAACGGEA